jgi:hypothetical protein
VAPVEVPRRSRPGDQIANESHGNPLALLEFPRAWNVASPRAGSGCPKPIRGDQQDRTKLRAAPRRTPLQTQPLVLTAAAAPLGDPILLHRAAQTLGIDMAAADPAVDAGLVRIAGRIEYDSRLLASA